MGTAVLTDLLIPPITMLRMFLTLTEDGCADTLLATVGTWFEM